MNLKLLIADDEITSIKRIDRQINFSNLYISEIRYAEDGQLALEICQDWRPDILISDIVMPRMNGIELTKNLRQANANLQVIFISGYSDKQYLKSAICLNVINYIEKPIDMKELSQALQCACSIVENISRNEAALYSLENERLNKLEEQIALTLSSRHFTQEELAPYVKEYSAIGYSYDNCVSVKVNFCRDEERTVIALTRQKSYIINIANALSLHCCSAVKYNYLICFIFSKNKSNYINKFNDEIAKEFTRQRLHFYIGVGKPVNNMTQLHDSYLEALSASAVSFFHEPAYISYYHKYIKIYDLTVHNPIDMIHSIYSVSKDQFIFNLRNITSLIKQCEATDISDIKNFYFNMISNLFKLSKKDGVSLWPEYQSDYSLSDHVMSSDFLIDILDFLIIGIKKYYKYVERDYYNNSTVDWMIRYIRQNYTNPNLSVNSLSQELNLSETYICHLYKDTTGNTLKNYITEYRMKKAVELLKDSRNQVSDIAIRVGYRNGNYFSFRFKDYFGCTPSEYKEYHE